jgi:predicted nucleic acid-binding protein
MALMAESEFSISTQVMAEFVHTVRRKASPPLTEDQIDAWLDEMVQRDHTAIDSAIVRRGTEISRRYRLSYYDGAILAAAERLGCDTVLSEDMTDGQSYGSVTVNNPFKGS